MSKPKTSSTAVVVVTSTPVISDKAKLAKFQASTADQLKLIDRTEAENNNRRLVVGLALMCIRDSLKRGEWLPWLRKNSAGTSQRQCYYMIAAAERWIEDAKLAKQVAAISTGDLTLTLKSEAMEKLAAAATKFLDGRTWGELLADLDIRDKPKLGGARNVTPAAPDEPADAETLYVTARDEIGGVISTAERLLLTENQLQHLVGHEDEVRGIVTSLRALADKVEAAATPILKK